MAKVSGGRGVTAVIRNPLGLLITKIRRSADAKFGDRQPAMSRLVLL